MNILEQELKFAPYSFSALNLYKGCARKYKYSKIDKIDPGPRDMTALLKGGAVHDILDKFPEPSTHKLAPKYQNIFDSFKITEIGKKYLYSKCIKEHKFGLNKELKECSYYDKSALFRGAVDFTGVINNTLHICDWKTGKYKDEIYQDYTQLVFYSIYFFLKYPELEELKISFVYIEHALENSVILKRINLKSYILELLGLIESLENDRSFEKSITGLCDYCEFQDYCDSD